ncbi:MAG: PilZ domain-containing protein [Nitrospinae bacterium]|nr:PilZ domain-containing protein [Nitrospinota bacterium]
MPDQRQHPRIRKHLFTAVKWYDEEGEINGADIGETLDISTGGILVRTEAPLPFKARLTISLAMEDEIIKLEGEVIRLERESDQHTLMGLRFVNVDGQTGQALAKALEDK